MKIPADNCVEVNKVVLQKKNLLYFAAFPWNFFFTKLPSKFLWTFNRKKCLRRTCNNRRRTFKTWNKIRSIPLHLSNGSRGVSLAVPTSQRVGTGLTGVDSSNPAPS
jgi:hypothetical protein